MSQEKNARALKDNEAKAVCRMIRVSPQKLNLVAQLIRGKKVDRALADLTFSHKRIAADVKKTLESAIANAENNHEPGRGRSRRRRSLRRQGAGHEALSRPRPRPGRPGREALLEPDDRRARSRSRGEGLRRERWDRKSIRSVFVWASTAPGTRAGSPTRANTASCFTRISPSAKS